MPTVYVVQNQLMVDRASGELVSKFDLEPAREYGELRILLGSGAGPWRPEQVIAQLEEGLAEFGDDDYLLLIGNPCIIGWATAIAAQINDGRVAMLQWHGREKKYIPVRAVDL
jgi:hypothetical protein